MIVSSTDRIAQCGKPCPLDQSGINRELRPRHSSRIERIQVLRIGFQLPLLQLFRPLHQFLDPLLSLRVCRMMRLADETVVSVFPGVHRSHAVKLADQHRRQHMIDRKGIIGMLLHDPLKILDCVLVIKVVEAFEGAVGQRITRAEGWVLLLASSLRRILSTRRNTGTQQSEGN